MINRLQRSHFTFILSVEGVFIDALFPPNAIGLLYTSKADYIGKSIYDILPEFLIGKIESAFNKVRQLPKEIVEFEYTLTVDSQEFDFVATCFSELDEFDNINRIVVDIRDIGSENENIHFLTGVLETSVVGIMSFTSIRDTKSNKIIDFQWRTTNKIGANLFEIPFKDIAGKQLLELLPKTKENGLFDEFVKVVELNSHLDIEQYFGPKFYNLNSEQGVWFRIIAKKMQDGFVTTIENITEKKNTETKLYTLYNEFEHIFNGSQDALFLIEIVDGQFVFLRNNESYFKHTGISLDSFRGKTPIEVFGKDIGNVLNSNYQRCVDAGKAIQYDEEIELNGQQTYWHTVLSPYFEEGTIKFIIGSARHITEQKIIQQERDRIREEFEHVFDGSSQAIYLIEYKNDEFYYVRNNKAHQEQTGLRTEDIKTKTPKEIHGERAKYTLDKYEECISSNKPISYEVELTLNGTYRAWRTLLTPYKTKNNRTFIIGAALEITAEKIALNELEFERSLLNMLMETSQDDVYFKDVDSKFIRVNKATATKLGVENPKDIIGKSDFDFFLPEIANRTFDDEQTIIKTGQPILSKDEEGRRKDDPGNLIWGSSSKVPMIAPDGSIKGIIGITRDITDRKATELALKESEQRFKLLADNMLDLVILFSMDGAVNYISPSLKPILGYEIDDLVNKKIFHLIEDKQNKESIKSALESAIKGEIVNGVEFTIKHKDGTTIWLSTNARCIYSDEGTPSQILTVSRNVTDRISIMNDLRDSNQQKDKLFSVISHDLRNPIAGAVSLSNLLLDNYDDYSKEEMLDFVKMFKASTVKLNVLMEDLLNWAKSQLNTVQISLRTFLLIDIYPSLESYIHDQAASKKINLKWEIKPQTELYSDPMVVLTILRNFISNAIKFSQEGKSIKLTCNKEVNGFRLNVTDSGVGMTAEQIDDILAQSKFTTTYGTDGEKGSGLGLNICKDYAKKIGANMHITSEVGKGTTCSLFIPDKK